MSSAFLLVSHGSSDQRHTAGLSRLANLVRHALERFPREAWIPEPRPQAGIAQFETHFSYRQLQPLTRGTGAISSTAHASTRFSLPPVPTVGIATLEATSVPLAQQIEMFARRVMAQGIRQVIIIPLFLLPGVHVKEDLPHEIRLAASRLPDRIRLVCTPYLGSHASFKRFVSSRLQAVAADRCILLAHGSRRPGGNRSVQQLSTILGADVAFWATAPDLESQVFELMAQGHQLIAIAPHFLFPGSITDAIARRTEALAERLPHVTLRLLPPLGTSTELARVVCEIASSAQYGLPSANRDSELRSLAPSGITA